VSTDRKDLLVHGWNSQCGVCRYGGGSWADSPAREGKPVLTPDSQSCPDCGVVFTHRAWLPGYGNERVEELAA
jgi:hypothetical protein